MKRVRGYLKIIFFLPVFWRRFYNENLFFTKQIVKNNKNIFHKNVYNQAHPNRGTKFVLKIIFFKKKL